MKEPPSPACKEVVVYQSSNEKSDVPPPSKERRPCDAETEYRSETTSLLKHVVPTATKDVFSNPGSPEFDSSFYSSVSCNIRENLLHHLDGKLQTSSTSSSLSNGSSMTTTTTTTTTMVTTMTTMTTTMITTTMTTMMLMLMMMFITTYDNCNDVITPR